MIPGEFWDAINLGEMISEDLLVQAMLAEGRNGVPAVLWAAWDGEALSYDTLAKHVGAAWSLAEFPDQCLEREQWLEMFQLATFTVDGKRQDPPTEPLTLWRGSVADRKADWSWTVDRKVAEHYASGKLLGRPKGEVWQVTAPPEVLLAANLGADGRKESEYIVNTEGLDIVLATKEK